MRNRTQAVLELSWLLIAILTPLWVNLWGLHLFDYSKAALMRSLVWVMAAIWIAGLAKRVGPPVPNPGGGWTLLAKAFPPIGGARGAARLAAPLALIHWTVGLLSLTLTLTTVMAFDWRLSLYGSVERGQGLLTQLSYLVLFLIVFTRLRTMAQARRLAYTLTMTAVVIALLSLAQAAGWNPFRLVTDARSALYATLGRANFVGAYLAILLPIVLYLIVLAKGRRRGLFILIAAITVTVIGLTQARSAWLATTVGVALFCLLALWPRLRLATRWALVGAGLLLLSLSLAVMLWAGRAGGSIAARLTIWEATLHLIAQRPWLGSGPESLGLLFPQVFPPQLVYYQGRDVFVDRAHNLPLDWLVEGGAVLALSWLFLFVVYFRQILHALSSPLDRERRLILAAAAAGVGANLAGNLVSFDVVATATVSWLLMALSLGIVRGVGRAPSITNDHRRPYPKGRLLGVATIGLTAILLIVHFNARPLAADALMLRAQRQATAGDWQRALQSSEQAVAMWPFSADAIQALGKIRWRRAATWSDAATPHAADDLRQAQTAYQATLRLRPANFVTWIELGEIYATQALAGDNTQAVAAQAAFEQAASLAPNHARLHVRWGEVQFALANTRSEREAAMEMIRYGSNLDATDGYAYLRLGQALQALGRTEAAQAAYRQAIRWSPELASAYLDQAGRTVEQTR